MLDHLLVVVAGQERLVVAAVGHRQPADEVGQPDVRRPLLLRVLVQVVVELPGLVADPEVVLLVADEVVEDHEVGEQDLVHPPDRLEAVQVVLGRLALDVARLVGEEGAGRMDPLAARLEHRRHRVLGEPVDLEVGVELAQLVGDRGVALRVAEPDRRGDVERALPARLAARPARAAARAGATKSRSSRFTLTGSRACGKWPDPSRIESSPLASSASRAPDAQGRTASSRPVDHEHRAMDAREQLAHALLVLEPRRQLGRDQRLGVRLEPPADRVLALLRRVRLGEALREEELEEVLVVLEPVVAVPLPPADVRRRAARSNSCIAFSRGVAGGSGRAGAMNTILSTRSGWLGGEVQRPLRAPRERHQHRALRAGRVHHGERVGGELLLAVGVAARTGRSERPLPRPSNVSTRQWRAR